jgi:hypothetical protein
MPESFGVRLRQQRERQQIALATIAEQTKIKLSLLEELERDDVSHWPTGIFRRAFMRAYAHAIGLDQDVVVREFLEIHPEPPEVVEADPALSPSLEGAESHAAPPMRLRYLVGSALDSLLGTRRGTPPQRTMPHVPAPATGAPVAGAAAAGAPLAAPSPRPVARPAQDAADLVTLARLCSDFARFNGSSEPAPLLRGVVEMLDAVGLIVWASDAATDELRPSAAHGYSDRVLAQLPRVGREADNATAAAFRSVQASVVRGRDGANGALTIPIVAPSGCVGVLAIELKPGCEDLPRVRALATVVAAQLARLVESPPAGAGEHDRAVQSSGG